VNAQSEASHFVTYYYSNQVSENNMDYACSTHWRDKKLIQNLSWKIIREEATCEPYV